MYFAVILTFLLSVFEMNFAEDLGRVVTVNTNWDLPSALGILFFLSPFLIDSYLLLPIAWSVSSEFIANIFYTFKIFFSKNIILLFIVFFSFYFYLYLQILVTHNGSPFGVNFGTFGLPGILRGIIGVGVGFFVRKNLIFFKSKKLLLNSSPIILLVLYFLPFKDTAILYNNFAFGIFLIFITQFDIKRESFLGQVSYYGGGMTYSIYILQQFTIDLVNFIMNKRLNINFKFTEQESYTQLILRFLLTLLITLILAYPVEQIGRRISKAKPL